MKKLIADYLEGGFLENITDMFKHDKTLYSLIGEILEDERGRVRLGIIALIESLKMTDPHGITTTIPNIAKLLKNPNPTIRGDAAHALGLIGHKDALPFLLELSEDKNKLVRQIIEESIELITAPVK